MRKLISMVDFVLNESTNKEVAKNFSGFSDIQNNKRESWDNSVKYAELLKRPIQREDCIGEKAIFEGFEEINGIASNGSNLIPDECFGMTKIEAFVKWNLIFKS